MAKKIISASVDEETVKEVDKRATKERRSFSQMIDVLLSLALSTLKSDK